MRLRYADKAKQIKVLREMWTFGNKNIVIDRISILAFPTARGERLDAAFAKLLWLFVLIVLNVNAQILQMTPEMSRIGQKREEVVL